MHVTQIFVVLYIHFLVLFGTIKINIFQYINSIYYIYLFIIKKKKNLVKILYSFNS